MRSSLAFSRSFAVILGTTAVAAFTASAQVWEYPFPRSVLGAIGLSLLLGTLVLVIHSILESAVETRVTAGRSSFGMASWPLMIIAVVASSWFLLRALDNLHQLWPCYDVRAPQLCALQDGQIAQLTSGEFNAMLAEHEAAAAPSLLARALTNTGQRTSVFKHRSSAR